MDYRLTIDGITPQTKEWTAKVQVIEKGLPKESRDGRTRFQILVLEDEKEQQVAAILYGDDIDRRANSLTPFSTYLVSPLTWYLQQRYEWVLDKFTLVEELTNEIIEDPPLRSPRRLNTVPFADLRHRPLKSEFDILAVVVNCGSIKYVGSHANKCREAIVMDSSMQPTLFSLWENYADIDGAELVAKIAKYPVIVAKRITRTEYGGSSLSTKFNSVILINPPYPQVTELTNWVTENKQILSTYRQRSSLQTAPSPVLVPLHDNVTAIADISVHSPIQMFQTEAEMSVPTDNQDFYELLCSECGHLYRTGIKKDIKCLDCGRKAFLTPRARIEVEVADGSGSASATLSGEPAEKFLQMTASEIYEIVCTQKQQLPLERIRRHLAHSLFQIHLKKSFSRTSELRLSVMSFVQKQGMSEFAPPAASMEIGSTSNASAECSTSRGKLKEDANAMNGLASKRQQVEPETPPKKK